MISFNTHEDSVYLIDVSIPLNCQNKVGLIEQTEEHMNEPQYVVRRITPIEAERLQGFPDRWTDIEYNGRPAPDTLRYKALGNSMTVNVMRWLAERILEADKNEAKQF